MLQYLIAGLTAPTLASVGGVLGPDGTTPLRQVAQAAPADRSAGAPARADARLLARAANQPSATFRVIVQRRQGDQRADAVVAAQLFQRHPEWANDQVKWLLTHTSQPLGTWSYRRFFPYDGQGAGALHRQNALAFDATPNTANQGLPISAQLIGPKGQTTYSNTTSSSWSSSSWSSSSWTTARWSSALA